MKKQAPKVVVYKIDTYLIEKNINSTKVHVIQILLSEDIALQPTNKKEAKKLR